MLSNLVNRLSTFLGLRKEPDPLGSIQTPFFILGSPRSGTTMLRDLLREHPRLECPEETHFFRWSYPYGSLRYFTSYKNQKLFAKHREIDGIEDDSFFKAMGLSKSRKEISNWYGHQILQLRNNPNGRWFDKTPQNVHGALLIRAEYPDAKFIHIHRNPLNVVASLMEGKVMPVQSLNAAINAWLESAMIMEQFRLIAEEQLLNIPYEELTSNPEENLRACFDFLREDAELVEYETSEIHPEKNKYEGALSEEQIDHVIERTEPYFSLYGYVRPGEEEQE